MEAHTVLEQYRFNPRARAGRDGNVKKPFKALQCFNPRARAGRDNSTGFLSSSALVSIHAPARGATGIGAGSIAYSKFQSTRPRGARHKMFTGNGKKVCFNPRARAGRDHHFRV